MPMMQLTEVYHISFGSKRDAKNIPALREMCSLSRDLFNRVNYIYRQGWTGHPDNIPEYRDLLTKKHAKWTTKDGTEHEGDQYFIDKRKLVKRMSDLNEPSYRAVKAKIAQHVINQVFEAYTAFFHAMKRYKTNPEEFFGRPQPPRYKDEKALNCITLDYQSAYIQDDGKVRVRRDVILETIRSRRRKRDFNVLRIVPKSGGFQVEIVYDNENGEYSNAAKQRNRRLHSAAIDIGVDNLATVTSDDPECVPFIVSGGAAKSVNQYFNKKLAQLESAYSRQGLRKGPAMERLSWKRRMLMRDIMHKASRRVTDWCILHDVHTVYVGRNKQWKNKCDMDRVSNQTFITIPHLKFIEQLRYKLEIVGIKLVEIEEGYTSKCSALDCETIGKHEVYAGKRIRRGLFRTGNGRLLNADVNGSLNILRLGTGNPVAAVNTLFNPTRLKNLNAIRDDAFFEWRPTDRGDASSPQVCNSCESTGTTHLESTGC